MRTGLATSAVGRTSGKGASSAAPIATESSLESCGGLDDADAGDDGNSALGTVGNSAEAVVGFGTCSASAVNAVVGSDIPGEEEVATSGSGWAIACACAVPSAEGLSSFNST